MLHGQEWEARMLKKTKWIIASFFVVAAVAAVIAQTLLTSSTTETSSAAVTPTTTVGAVSEEGSDIVYDENFEDFNHYDHIEGYDEDAEEQEDHDDHSAQASDFVERTIASTGEEAKLVKKLEKITDDKWGTFDIELLDAGHPSYAPLQLKIFVTCKDQVKMIQQRPPPKREPLLKSLRMCEYRGHEFDKSSKTLTIKYLLQSPDASPNEPVCNEIWEQDFSMTEACSKWKIAN